MKYEQKVFTSDELKGQEFDRSEFINCKFVRTDLRFTSFNRCNFLICDLSSVTFDITSFIYCSFPESKLSNLDFSEAFIKQCNFTKAIARNCVFQQLKAGNKNLKRKFDLTNSIFSDADLWIIQNIATGAITENTLKC